MFSLVIMRKNMVNLCIIFSLVILRKTYGKFRHNVFSSNYLFDKH